MAPTSKYSIMKWESEGGVADALRMYKQKMTLVCEDNEVTEPAAIARKIKIGLGDEGLRRLNASGLTEQQLQTPTAIWQFLERNLQVSVNFRIQRLLLMQMRQRSDETLDDFVTRARTHALRCEFTDDELKERIIEIVIAGTAIDDYRRDLLGKDATLTLDQALTLGQQHEAAVKGTKQLRGLKMELSSSTVATVDHVAARRSSTSRTKSIGQKCRNCGRSHLPRECPAFGTKCDVCHTMGHWKKCCRKAKLSMSDGDRQTQKQRSTRSSKQLHEVAEGESLDTDSASHGFDGVHLSAVDAHRSSDKAFTKLAITARTRREAHAAGEN